jgi:hypothetical protein
MWIMQNSSAPLRQCMNLIMRWQRLIRIAGNPYRPELHYMRGRGPKWHAKHHDRGESGAL